jgi:hypothetical protein
MKLILGICLALVGSLTLTGCSPDVEDRFGDIELVHYHYPGIVSGKLSGESNLSFEEFIPQFDGSKTWEVLEGSYTMSVILEDGVEWITVESFSVEENEKTTVSFDYDFTEKGTGVLDILYSSADGILYDKISLYKGSIEWEFVPGLDSDDLFKLERYRFNSLAPGPYEARILDENGDEWSCFVTIQANQLKTIEWEDDFDM